MTTWLDNLIRNFAASCAPDSFFALPENLFALLALLCVGLTCGAVGSVVVGTRMAFFSDALAHCAFAGIGIGFLFFELVLEPRGVPPDQFWTYVTPLMIGFGICVGLGIAAVKQATGLASDTVIGVFFAGAIGLAAALRRVIHSRAFFSLEDILFGDPLFTQAGDVLNLGMLVLLTFGLLAWIGNALFLASFNQSLALSRRMNVQLHQYLFMILLAILVNLCLRTVGALLINTLLVVPGATAANLSRNLRSMFWLTIVICVGCCIGGHLINWEVNSAGFKLDIGGTVVLLAVGMFFLSVLLGPILRQRKSV